MLQRSTVEAIEVLRRAWTGERFSFQGRIHSFDRVQVTPPPAQEGGIPIYLGGVSDAAVRRARDQSICWPCVTMGGWW